MMKPKITLVRNEEPEEEEEELEEEEQVEEIKPIKKEKPKQVNDEYSSDDKPTLNVQEVIDMIEGHLFRANQLIQLLK